MYIYRLDVRNASIQTSTPLSMPFQLYIQRDGTLDIFGRYIAFGFTDELPKEIVRNRNRATKETKYKKKCLEDDHGIWSVLMEKGIWIKS